MYRQESNHLDPTLIENYRELGVHLISNEGQQAGHDIDIESQAGSLLIKSTIYSNLPKKLW